MLWELIATLAAGVGAAGLALLARSLVKTLPKTLIPAAGGLGMLAFQIASEYQWFEHTRARLPEGAVVIAEQTESAWYKPWSHFKPAISRFAAVDSRNHQSFRGNPHQRQTLLYFFERRAPVQHWPVLIDCTSGMQANLPASPSASAEPDWQETPYSREIARWLCADHAK
ncbi:MAG: hypothetical protein Q4A06_03310 [Cardiobacteriaceae bacterium]|nr:hypothetical protein [Cardiobacteriaceae bacterium]